MLSAAVAGLPPPPYPESIDLAGLRRLQLPDSVLIRPEIVRGLQDPSWGAMLRLTVCSLQQVPAGSLPTDETELRILAGMSTASEADWDKARAALGMSWTACSDQRLYNYSLVEPVLAMWRQLKGARMGALRSVESRQRRTADVAA